MALVDELASDLIEKKLGRKSKHLLQNNLQDFRLEKTKYNPKETVNLVFGSPSITITG